jgi:hypothetical protein
MAIDVEQMHQAKEILIRRKDTHLDSLGDRLQESRVRFSFREALPTVLEPMMAGLGLGETRDDDSPWARQKQRNLLVDLGLLRREESGGLVIANPIYREILSRMFAPRGGDVGD